MPESTWSVLYCIENRNELILASSTCALSFVITFVLHLQPFTRIDMCSFAVGFVFLLWVPYFVLLPEAHSFKTFLLVGLSCSIGAFSYWWWDLDWQTNVAIAVSTILAFKCQGFHENFLTWMNSNEAKIEGVEQQVTDRSKEEVEKVKQIAYDEVKDARKGARFAREDARLAKEEARLAKEEARLAKEEARLAKEEARLAKEECRKTAHLLAKTLDAQSKELGGLVQKMDSLSVRQTPRQ